MAQDGTNPTLLGPYRLGARIGEGAMGVVYRAEDPRLGRAVAIKVLPSSFAADAERLRRFEQEARTLAAVNHPNLVHIYDIGRDQAGSPYLVMELLEGETLRTRLHAGALPERRALEWTQQLADGLAAAHERGIVHRDLKPENIFITRESRLKILDFGLAKLALPESGADAATIAGSSLPGTIIGTAGYMSPEQVRAEPVDARSDLFATGAILFEMATGKRAFQRPSAVETMAAVLQSEPAIESGSVPALPLALDRIARRCLEKQPSQRFQTARDLSFALQQVLDGSLIASVVAPPPAASSVPPAAAPSPAAARRQAWRPAAAALAVVVVATVIAWAVWPKASPVAPAPSPAVKTTPVPVAPAVSAPTVAPAPVQHPPAAPNAVPKPPDPSDAAGAGIAAGTAALQAMQIALPNGADGAAPPKSGEADSAQVAKAAGIALYPGAVSEPGSQYGKVYTMHFHTADAPRQVIEFYRPRYPQARITEDQSHASLVLMQGGSILTVSANTAAGGATNIHISDIQH